MTVGGDSALLFPLLPWDLALFPFCLLELSLLLPDISMKFRELILQKTSPTNKKVWGGGTYVPLLLAH